MRLLFALSLFGCDPSQDKATDTDPPSGTCEGACLNMEATALNLTGMESADYQALCADAPADVDCESCYIYIQDAIYSPNDIGWSCGCGLDDDSVRECIGQPDMSQDTADDLMSDCLESCEQHDLAMP